MKMGFLCLKETLIFLRWILWTTQKNGLFCLMRMTCKSWRTCFLGIGPSFVGYGTNDVVGCSGVTARFGEDDADGDEAQENAAGNNSLHYHRLILRTAISPKIWTEMIPNRDRLYLFYIRRLPVGSVARGPIHLRVPCASDPDEKCPNWKWLDCRVYSAWQVANTCAQTIT